MNVKISRGTGLIPLCALKTCDWFCFPVKAPSGAAVERAYIVVGKSDDGEWVGALGLIAPGESVKADNFPANISVQRLRCESIEFQEIS